MVYKKRDTCAKRGICTKRGIADTQFHWLFVILAGGFIFFFFALFINQGIVANQNKQTAIMLQYFDGVLSSSQNIQNLNDPIESTPSIIIEPQCELGGQSRLVFVGQELDKKTAYLPIFSSRRISGAAYALKTLPYDAPFRVDNPIYLTDTSTLYVVFSPDPDVLDRYARLLPSHANVVTIDDFSKLTQSGFRDVIVITQDGTNNAGFDEGLRSKLPAALISANLRWVDVDVVSKTVNYYYKEEVTDDYIFLAPSQFLPPKGSDDSVNYEGDALLLGAIMSEDSNIYLCNKEKLVDRARTIAMQIYARANQLDALVSDRSCQTTYGDAQGEIMNGLNAEITDINIQNVIASDNGQLILYSCPTLY